MPASVNVEVKIPAICTDSGYRNEGPYETELTVKMTPSGRVKLGYNEFKLEDLEQAMQILRAHNAVRT